MLDDLDGPDAFKRVVRKGEPSVKVADHVRRSRIEIDVNSDGPRRLFAPTAQLEHSLATRGIQHGRDFNTEECET